MLAVIEDLGAPMANRGGAMTATTTVCRHWIGAHCAHPETE